MNDQAYQTSILVAFNILDGLAIFLIILILLPPLFCKSVHRRTPWYSHMLSWLVVAIALLLMVGHQQDAEPPSSLCFVQSVLLYAAPPLTTFSMTCYLLDINIAITHLLSRKYLMRESKTGASILLACFPWVIFLGVIIEVSIVFAMDDRELRPGGDKDLRLFCHYNRFIPNIITWTLVTVAALILIPVKVWTALLLTRKFRSMEWSSIKLSQVILSAFIRTAVFSGLVLVGIILGQLAMIGMMDDKKHDPGWCLVLPLMPIMAALMYGIHQDVLRAVMFWKKKQDAEADQTQDSEEETAVGVQANANPENSTVRPELKIEIPDPSL